MTPPDRLRSPLFRLSGAVVFVLCMLGGVPDAQALKRKAPAVEICADTMAYSAPLKSAERKQREEEARQHALTLLALQLWSDAFDPPGTSWARFDPEASETDKSRAVLLGRYRVRDRLEGGTYRYGGNKKAKQVSYCFPEDAYRRVLELVKDERRRKIDEVQERFAQVEQMVAEDRGDAASSALTTLRIEVVNEALENVEYRSRTTDVARPFYQWLNEWGLEATRGPEFVNYMVGRATDLMNNGYLDEADRYVQEAIDSDRDNIAAREVRKQIHQRRVERVELVQDARRFAEAGRFAAADRSLEQAREMGRDDTVLLETAQKSIEGMRAAYLELNPRQTIVVYLAAGTLGADKRVIEERVSAVNGFPVDASEPLMFGAGANFRLGRWLLLSTTGGWGFSQDQETLVGQVPLELFEMYQLTGSVGLRTPRTPKRKLAYQLTGGMVWEKVDANTLFAPPVSSSDSQTAVFVRLAVEMKSAEFFLQQGFGFDESSDSLIGWSNNLQFGIAALF